MKRIAFTLLLTLAASMAFAFPGFESAYFPMELKAIGTELGDRNLGDLKTSEVLPLVERLDVARQKDHFVMMAGGLSLAWPGAGQFASGDWGGGSLHTGIHLGITAGTLVWANSLLPADLRVGNLNYIDSKKEDIENAWKSHRGSEFLPAAGALIAGGAVDLVLRIWSAKDAQETAKAKIDQGKITFEPRFDEGRLGFGMRW